MHRVFIVSIAILLGSAAAHAVPPTVVVPATQPNNGAWGPIPIPLALLGIDPAGVTVSGALRGTVEYDGTRLLYLPDRSTFTLTDFDLLRIGVRGVGTVLNVAMVGAESAIPRELVAHAGDTAVADLGWELAGAAEWDPASGSYVVAGTGELAFDFLRDDVTDQTFDTSAQGAQSGSGTSVTLRPPPPGAGAPWTLPGSMLVYEGGGGSDLWELWLRPTEDQYMLEAVLTSATGSAARTDVPVPAGPEIGIDLGSGGSGAVLVLHVAGSETVRDLNRPPNFGFDRTWHRFGNLGSRSQENALELDDLRVARSSIDLARQVVVVDDFDAPEWTEEWTSPTAGALKLGQAGLQQSERDGELVASLDQAAVVGPDYLERTLEVPRVAMTCRVDLDLSALVSWGDGGSATVLAFRDESQPDPAMRDYARLQVRQQGQERQVRLVGPGADQTETTPWVPLATGAATLEVQWQKTAADQGRLDLWIDGCGPPWQPCGSGWELTGIEQTGLVTAVRLGILASTATVNGEVRLDDVACAGDSWVKPE